MPVQLQKLVERIRSMALIIVYIEVHDARLLITGRNQEFYKSLHAIQPHVLVMNKMDSVRPEDGLRYRNTIVSKVCTVLLGKIAKTVWKGGWRSCKRWWRSVCGKQGTNRLSYKVLYCPLLYSYSFFLLLQPSFCFIIINQSILCFLYYAPHEFYSNKNLREFADKLDIVAFSFLIRLGPASGCLLLFSYGLFPRTTLSVFSQ